MCELLIDVRIISMFNPVDAVFPGPDETCNRHVPIHLENAVGEEQVSEFEHFYKATALNEGSGRAWPQMNVLVNDDHGTSGDTVSGSIFCVHRRLATR